jgi:centrosomal protein CEP104
MIAKLEVILNVLQEFGYDSKEFSHEDIFYILAAPSLFHPTNEVRLLSIEVIAALYQLVGQDIRIMIDSIENLKPGLKEQIHTRLDSIDQENGGPLRNQMEKGLSLVMEQE